MLEVNSLKTHQLDVNTKFEENSFKSIQKIAIKQQVTSKQQLVSKQQLAS
jgi:hypothetical protein